MISFIAMRTFGVDANVVSLSGIAIAIGTMVDMGIVLTENMLEAPRARLAPGGSTVRSEPFRDATVVGGAVQ